MRKQLRMVDGHLVGRMLCKRGSIRLPCPFVTELDCLAKTALSVVESRSYRMRDNFVRRFCHFGALAMHSSITPTHGRRCENLPYLHTPLYCVWQLYHAAYTHCSPGPPPRVNSH